MTQNNNKNLPISDSNHLKEDSEIYFCSLLLYCFFLNVLSLKLFYKIKVLFFT